MWRPGLRNFRRDPRGMMPRMYLPRQSEQFKVIRDNPVVSILNNSSRFSAGDRGLTIQTAETSVRSQWGLVSGRNFRGGGSNAVACDKGGGLFLDQIVSEPVVQIQSGEQIKIRSQISSKLNV